MLKLIWDVKPAIEALRAIRERLRDLRPAWQSILIYLRKATKEQFASEGARGGSAWQPLNIRYAQWKAIRYPGQPILRASDKLFRSLTEKSRDSVERATKAELTYGTKVPYGRYHQKGTPRMPRRSFLVITDADRREIKRLAREHLRAVSAASGFEPVGDLQARRFRQVLRPGG